MHPKGKFRFVSFTENLGLGRGEGGGSLLLLGSASDQNNALCSLFVTCLLQGLTDVANFVIHP